MAKGKLRQKIKDYITAIFFLIFFLFIVIFPTVMAYFKGYERIIHVDKDAYVLEATPDVNYGSENYLHIGKYSLGKVHAYYHFNISSHSYDWKEARIYVRFESGTNLIDIGVNLTLNNWDEMTITWNNKLEHIEYKGHILCDGFDFWIPIDSDEIMDGGVSVCLYGKQDGEEGYIEGYSKEGASYKGQIASIELIYIGYDPVIFWPLIRVGIFILGLIGLIVFASFLARHSKPIRIKRKQKHKVKKKPQNIVWNHPVHPPAPPHNPFEMMERYFPKVVPTAEKEINQYITLKLENGKTFIYVNGHRFIQCIRLILNIQKTDIPKYDKIESIDEAAKIYSKHVFQNRIVQGPMAVPDHNQRHDITPEQEFWGHCSNLQAWVENDYDTRILMSNISFPLLKELSRAGEPKARRVYKEEIALRLESGYPSVVQYLLAQGYIAEFSPEEFETILETTDLIQKLSSDTRVLTQLLKNCSTKFPTLMERIILQIFDLPDGKNIMSSVIRSEQTSKTIPVSMFHSQYSNYRFLKTLKVVLTNLLDKIDEKKSKEALNWIQTIDEILESQYERLFKREWDFKKNPFEDNQNQFIINIAGGDLPVFKIAPQDLQLFHKMESRCKFCGKKIPKDKDICEWCGHKKDNDEGGFFPHPFIFKPPGGGGSMKAVAIVRGISKA